MSATTSSLTDRVVAITGGARGIGRATADGFAQAGARVAIGDLDGELASKTAAELAAATGAVVMGGPLDVTDPASFTRFLDTTETEANGLDVLVNNAGIMPTGHLLDERDDMTDRMIAVNLRAVITGSKLAAQRFVPRGCGAIVNVASAAGLFGTPGLATYAATKAAVLLFSDSLGLELRDTGVHVGAVLPGLVRTELSAGTNYSPWLAPFVAVEPEDVAAAIIACVRRRKSRVAVPRRLSAVVKTASLLPANLRRRTENRVGLYTAFTHPDPVLREQYHRRIVGG
jgi:short-subunit dehydrogenase